MRQLAKLDPETRFALQEAGGVGSAASALDAALPAWQYADAQRIDVSAPPDAALEALRRVDMGRGWIYQLMMSLRQPAELLRQQALRLDVGYTFRDLERFGFAPLDSANDHEIVYGLIGRFWTPSSAPALVDADRYKVFLHPDYAKLAMGFLAEPKPEGGSRLVAEIRIRCLSERARWIFTGYWRMIRPLNGAVRRQLLRAVAADVDA
ncbi:MAG: hypothetical protein AAF684_05490 [Pseudomonadota bacterium]